MTSHFPALGFPSYELTSPLGKWWFGDCYCLSLSCRPTKNAGAWSTVALGEWRVNSGKKIYEEVHGANMSSSKITCLLLWKLEERGREWEGKGARKGKIVWKKYWRASNEVKIRIFAWAEVEVVVMEFVAFSKQLPCQWFL